MRPTATQLPIVGRKRPTACQSRGFALVITLSLMILLTVIAVGLLSLAGVSMRTSSQETAMQIARANAKMALLLAIGDLQKQLGPDRRISALADQRVADGDASQSKSAATSRQWTGVYNSWPDDIKDRPTPEFRAWLVSGDPATTSAVSAADTALTGTAAVELVGAGTLGPSKTGQVTVPAMSVLNADGKPARIAWWIGDQGMKAAVATPPPANDTSLGALRGSLQGAPRNAIQSTISGVVKPFEKLAPDDQRLPLVTSWKQSAFLASDVAAPRGLFHDLAAFSTGLLTNVRAGGFRKDLSMHLERPTAEAPTTALYTVAGENGINFRELWAYYHLYSHLKRSGGATFTTGGKISGSNSPYLEVADSPAACQNDEAFYFKQPVVISYQMILSFETRPVTVGGEAKLRLYVVADPVLTFWNPLDVPVVVPLTAFFSVKYWQIPYNLLISTNGGAKITYPLAASLTGASNSSVGDGNYLSLRAGQAEQLVFKPGEVIKVSQTGNTFVGSPGDHNLAGKSGFNYGGGVSLPVKELSGAVLDLKPTDEITYEAVANNLTAGKTSISGNTATGADAHTRHFSLTHHEYYIGIDRGDSTNSLGIGGMYIDWDFGDKRLKLDEIRGTSVPGTKDKNFPGSRLYADRFPAIFRPLTPQNARPLMASEINVHKAPFMMFSFNAKTERGSDLGTRCFARFNPRALHVDFYDLSKEERDILPYEYSVEPLDSWKNRSLEVSANGNAYFGGGMNAEYGCSFVTTHAVPRSPLVSLAAFQHSFANGFEMLKPPYGYAILNIREPLLPQISHAIGNSLAPPMIAPDQTEGKLPGARPLADHSYLANLALWDDWFLSGIASQDSDTFAKKITQKDLAKEFLTGKAKLPVVRYLPDLDGQDAEHWITTLFSGTTPNDKATVEIAGHLRVDGMFNVNSTSIEAWKAVLGSLNGRQVVVCDANGAESAAAVDKNTPVANLAAPQDLIGRANGSTNVKEPAQWTGRRTLTEDEIASLAGGIVKEVRQRGPFLSLADFVNRRLGADKDLARAGAIQNALDSPDVKVNAAYNSGRSVERAASARFTFPEAERGPLAYGCPGVVKQADILTPIAPVLSVRSDSFIIRAYGEAVDAAGKVTARAWCEAVLERDRNFVDPTDQAETPITDLISKSNQIFGRRYELLSFRWLNPGEV